MQRRKRFKLAFWMVAGVVLLLGIVQCVSFLPGQLETMKQAEAQGVAAQQISDFFWQRVIPQLLSYVMTTVAFTGILFFMGVLYEKLDSMVVQNPNYLRQLPYGLQEQGDQDMDHLFDEFELVDEEKP